MLARQLEAHEGVVFEDGEHDENHYQFDMVALKLASRALDENHSRSLLPERPHAHSSWVGWLANS